MQASEGYARSDYTPLKNVHFGLILDMHLSVVRNVFAKSQRGWPDPHYRYIDLTAGPGVYDGEAQSPLIFSERVKHSGVPCRAVFFEREQPTCDTLRQALLAALPNAIVRNEDFAPDFDAKSMGHRAAGGLLPLLHDFMPIDKDRYYGMVYYDPKPSCPMVEREIPFLADVGGHQRMGRMDFLLHLSATCFKRLREKTGATFLSSLARFGKKAWLVREPQGHHQWTFVLGTNYTEIGEYKRMHFYHAHSKRGRDIILTLEHTREELDLFGQAS